MDHLDTLVELARQKRLVKIWYQKAGHDDITCRTVEPYRFVERSDKLLVQAWQRDPEVDDPCWRHFRVDRISDVSDGGKVFTPRRSISLLKGEVLDFMNVIQRTPKSSVNEYRNYLRKAVDDMHLSDKERVEASNLAERLARKKLKLVHCQVFAEILMDIQMDGEVTDSEEEFLCTVRDFMDELGWAP